MEDLAELPMDQYRAMIESLPHMVWTCRGEDGACDYLSPQWIEYTGIPVERQLGYGWLEQLHPDDVELTKERWEQAASQGRFFDTEFRIRRYDGSYRWFKTRAVPIKDSAGRLVRWVGTNTDVAELHDKGEDATRKNQALEQMVANRTAELELTNERLRTVTTQLRTAQRLARLGSWDFDLQTNRVIWSPELFRVFELDPQLEPPSYDQQEALFAKESWHRLSQAIEHSRATGEGYELTLDVFRPNGERRITVAQAEALTDEAGKVVRLVGTFQDITRHERTRERLRELTERLQFATAAADIGVWDWDMQSDVLVWDEGMHRLYGTSPDNFPGAYRAWSEALHPEDFDAASTALKATVEHGQPFDTVFRIVRADGSVRHLHALAKVHRGQSGEAVRIVGVNLDVTEQRETELTLRRQERSLRELNDLLASRTAQAESDSGAKSRFVAKMSHDIRTPLGAVTGMMYLLTQTELSDHQRSLLETAHSSAQTLLGMINDILDLSKVEAGQLSLEPTVVRLSEVAEELLALMKGSALGRELDVDVSLDGDLPEAIVVDRTRLMQVLTNLAGNAIKFTERGRVRVSLYSTERNGQPLLGGVVEDTGQGIAPEQLERVFEPFAQGTARTTSSGTGLGLAIVRELVSAMGGSVRVESELGKGSRFSFDIALTEGAIADGTRDATVRAMVVSPHARERSDYIAHARCLGWEVVGDAAPDDAATSLEKQLASERGIPIVFLAGAPIDRLEELADTLRARSPNPRLTIIAVTEETVTGAEFRAAAGSAIDTQLTAPVDLPEIHEATCRALATRDVSWKILTRALTRSEGVQRLPDVKVLVVDDSEVNRQVAQKVLEYDGAIITASETAEAALGELRRQEFDVVLMDVQMPTMDGIDAVRIIRQELALTGLPVIALTAGALATERTLALEAGMTDFISKPFSPPRLVSAVRRCVENLRQHPLTVRSHAVQAQPTSAHWTEVAGIDMAAVKARLGDHQPLFNRLLKGFADDLRTFLDELQSEESIADPAGRIHQLRGAAGNLGANAIFQAASAAENALRKGDQSATVELENFRWEVQRFLDALVGADETKPSLFPSHAANSLDPQERELFIGLLSSRDLQALTWFESRRAALEQGLGTAPYTELSRAMGVLDYEAALQILGSAWTPPKIAS